MPRAAVVVLALAAAAAPLPPSLVEHAYSTGAYPLWQHAMTTASNVTPLSLLDVLIAGIVAGWIAMVVFEWRRRQGRAWKTAWRIAVRTSVWASALYLFFLASWGFNYRRVRLVDRLAFDAARVDADAVRALASTAVAQLNTLYAPAHATGWPEPGVVDPALASTFAVAQGDLGAARPAVPARPKRTLLDAYFRRAVVDGMTDPFFLETFVNSTVLPMERPFVVAHEWAHLAGYNDEGEANFVSWLACVRGDAARQYSGWLAIYSEASALLGRRDRQAVAEQLAAGPRDDLRAIADRILRNRSVRVSQAGWQAYNQYLKANRVEAGAASYSEVIRLILGTRLGMANVKE
jgi:hypothetical protein